jgi:hypothetical protein
VRAKRLGAVACSLTLGVLALGVTAPASYADQRHKPAKPAKHDSQPAVRHVSQAGSLGHVSAKHHASPAALVLQRRAAKPRNLHAATPAIPTVRPAIPAPKRSHVKIRLTDVLLPGLLGEDTSSSAKAEGTGSSAKHSSVLLGSRLLSETPAVVAPTVVAPTVVAPAVVAPETAPVPAVVPSVVVKRATRPLRPAVTAESLLDVTPVTPRRALAARQLSPRTLVAQTNSRPAAAPVHRPAAPLQTVSKELPRIGAWLPGPGSMTKTGTDLPLSLALGGLLLALAAARGVAGMRHPRSEDDGHLTFGAI